MAYTRKTRDRWDIEQNWGHGHGWEAVCSADTLHEAKARLREYRENQPEVPTCMRKRRIKIEGEKA